MLIYHIYLCSFICINTYQDVHQIQRIGKFSHYITCSFKRIKKNYEYLPLSTKRQEIICNRKRKACQFAGKERKSHEILRILLRLFNVYFFIKKSLKFIKIHVKK